MNYTAGVLCENGVERGFEHLSNIANIEVERITANSNLFEYFSNSGFNQPDI